MINKEKIYIPYLNQERNLHIYVPDNKKQEKLPVLYMFDGHNLFYDNDATYGKSWGLKKYFDKHQIQMIIVGIECNHENNERLNEFSPYSFHDEYWGTIQASGHSFLEWMSSDLKTYIDTHYPTITDRSNTFIGGSSMGGLMSIYGGAIFHSFYSKAICISPFLEYVQKQLETDLSKIKSLKDTTFYLSFGQKEFKTRRMLAIGCEANLAIARILEKKQAEVYTHCMINGRHDEASWEKEIPLFIKDLFK